MKNALRISFVLFLIWFSYTDVSLAQTPGMIIKPALAPGNSVLDPDGDGYVSQKTNGVQLGFTIPPDNDVFQSEIPYVAIIKPDPLSDLLRGPTGAFSEIVGVDAAGNNAILTYNDGTNFLIRFRLGGYAPNSKSYSIMIDTDSKFGFTGPNADPNAVPGNPGFEAEIVLETNFNVKAYNVNGTITPIEPPVATYSFETNCQKSMAVSTASGDPDYFYDFYLPLSSLSTLFTASTPLRVVAVTAMNPHPAIGNNALSDVGGVTTKSSVDQQFIDLVNGQTPTVPGQEVLDRSDCPTITGTILTTAATISGTLVGSAISYPVTVNVYKNLTASPIGTVTVNSGTPWTVTGISGLVAGDLIKATATETGKGTSCDNCDIETVAAACITPPAAPSSITTSSKGICGTIASGATLNIYLNGVLIHSTSTTIVGTLQIAGTSFSYKPNGSFSNCNSGIANMASGFYEVSQTVAGCESAKVSYSLTCTGNSKIPVITNPLYAGTILISGTYDPAFSASIELFVDGVSSGTTTASGGIWSFTSKTVTAGQIVKVVATESATCLAGTSNLITVTAVPAPVITSTLCGTITTVAGYIDATSGTVQIYTTPATVQGSAVAISSNGSWSVTGLSIASGTIYAQATLNGGITSVSSNITIGSKTSNAVAITDATILEGATSVSGTGTTGDLIKLYIGGAYTEYSTTVVSGNWSITVQPYEFYIGADVYVTATNTLSGQCEGSPSASKVVQCVVPTSPSYTGGSFSYCYGSAGSISLTSSQTGVVYQLVDNAGTAVGPASIGTGSGITLYTNALLAPLSNIFVKAYKIGYNSCSTTASTVINFASQNPSPTVSFTSTSLSILRGPATTLNFPYTAKSTNPPDPFDADKYTIAYSIAAKAQGFVDQAQNTIPASPILLNVPNNPAEGTYTGTVKIEASSGSSCSTSYGFTITVYGASSPPVIGVQPSGITICSNTTTVLSVTSPNATSYQWQSSDSYSGTYTTVVGGSGSTSASYTTANLTATKYYRVIVTNANGSTTSNVATVTVTGVPGAAGVITGTTSVCAGQSESYSIPAIIGATSYTWNYITGTGATIIGTTNSVSLNFALTATSGSLTVAGTNGCGNGTASNLPITVNPTPSFSPMNANSCSGAAFSVTPAGGFTYTWGIPVVTGGMTGGASGSGSSIGGTLVNTTSSTQTATYTVTPTTGSCVGAAFTLTVSVYPRINLSTAIGNTTCVGTSTGNIVLTVTGGSASYTSYAWTGPSSYTASTKDIIDLAIGTYNATVTDSNGCSATTSATITFINPQPVTPGIIVK